MTRQLRHELHAMVDDAPTVDVIDRALGTARTLRRRRAGAGVVAAVAVAAVLTTPFALAGRGLSAGPAGAPADCGPGMTGPVTSTADTGIAPMAALIVAHLPSGYTVARTRAGVWCGSPGPRAVRAYTALGADGGQVWVEFVARADKVPGTIYAGSPPFTSTGCPGFFDPAVAPWPWPSTDPVAPPAGPDRSVAPSPSDSWPWPSPSDSWPSVAPSPSDSWPSFTPSPSDSWPSVAPSPSDSWPSFTPSASAGSSDGPIGSPSPSDSWFSPSGSPMVSASGSPSAGAIALPVALFCRDATATSPMMFGLDTGSTAVVAAVWPDHHAIIARAMPPSAGLPPTGSVTLDQLIALVGDPALGALAGR